MSEHSHSSSHHHHHKMDGASKFKRKSLLAIERRKKIEKWSFYIFTGLAVLMVLLVVAAYTMG